MNRLCDIVKGATAGLVLAAGAANADSNKMHLLSTADNTPYSVTLCDSISDYRNDSCRNVSGTLNRAESTTLDVEGVAYFTRSSENLLSNLPQNNDGIFKDSFETGMSELLVEPLGLEPYTVLRDRDLFLLDLECDTPTEVTIVSTPASTPWDYSFDNLPAGFTPTPPGFTYNKACDGEITSTIVTATNESLPGTSDVAGIVFGDQPRITSFFNLGTSSETPAANGIIGPLEVLCDETFEGTLLATPSDKDWTYEYDNISSGVSTTPEGMITINYACNNPATTLSVDAQANSDGLVTNPVTVLFDVNTNTPSGPTILGLDYNFDGQINNNMLPTGDALELEVPYFCADNFRDMRIISDDPDNTTYTVLEGDDNAYVIDNNLLSLFSGNDPGCNTLEGITSDVVVRATNDTGYTDFTVPTRRISPQIKHVYVEPAPTSGGSPRPAYIAQFDSNKISEMINLPCDRVSGIPHKMTLEPIISHDDVALMRPTRSYSFEHNNQPSWMDLDMFDGTLFASPGLPPTCQDNGFVSPTPDYTIKVGSTQGPGDYVLLITVGD